VRVSRGVTLPELLVVLVLGALLFLASAPALATLRSAGRTSAAAHELAITLEGLRWKSVATGASHGLAFASDARGWSYRIVRDGNGNGLRTTEIARGTDPTLVASVRLEDRLSPVRLGFPRATSIAEIPPRTGTIADLSDPISFGRSDLVSFSPAGTSSSGTLYVTDGVELCAIVLFGPTSRLRVWRYDGRSATWKL
jgi:prepilin-type N-terminal cleavage/methylation domain-containing protein